MTELPEDWEARALRARDICLATKITVEIELTTLDEKEPVFRCSIQIGANFNDHWLIWCPINEILPSIEQAWGVYSQPVDYDSVP